MKSVKLVSTPLANHFKFQEKSCLSNKEEKEQMIVISYSSTARSLMYTMI